MTEADEIPNSWLSRMKEITVYYGLSVTLEDIKELTKRKWKMKVARAVQEKENAEYYKKASESWKMGSINTVKQAPSLEKYMKELTKKQATAVFRLRCKNTRAQADTNSFATIPICPLCRNGIASNLHYFSTCSATISEREQWDITNLDELYEASPDIDILRRYAQFALAVGIVPEDSG
jgi:hypothetical protein